MIPPLSFCVLLSRGISTSFSSAGEKFIPGYRGVSHLVSRSDRDTSTSARAELLLSFHTFGGLWRMTKQHTLGSTCTVA